MECSACHGAEPDGFAVPAARCGPCHASELETWQAGKHGVRTALALPPMQPSAARLPMHAAASGRELTCSACHAAHTDDRELAARSACLGCHSDDHSLAYASSRHAELFEAERRGAAPAGSGVSCATCHLPEQSGEDGHSTTQHNQNDNLRPNEKMIRSVCNRCHGLAFSIDALADAALVRSNFNRAPAAHVVSLDMAARRAEP
jgi:formate-dependent nitrite reductase cytochrome c552 subunit